MKMAIDSTANISGQDEGLAKTETSGEQMLGKQGPRACPRH
jgi:hypothetical protein